MRRSAQLTKADGACASALSLPHLCRYQPARNGNSSARNQDPSSPSCKPQPPPPQPACSPVEYNPSARSYSTEYESFSFSLIDWQSPLVPPPFPCDSDAFRFNKDNHHHHHPAPRHIISSSPTCLSFIFTFISLVLSSYHATPHSSY